MYNNGLLVKCYIWSIYVYRAEILTLWKVNQEYFESFKMWCWRRKETSLIDLGKNYYYAESMSKGTSCIQYKEGRPTVFVTSCLANAF
jgi:hypothetical protein